MNALMSDNLCTLPDFEKAEEFASILVFYCDKIAVINTLP